jgi:hypothetical protein
MVGPSIKDSQWIRQAFLVRAESLAAVDIQNRTQTSASLKFTDTTPGGNYVINPPPQFTRYADIRAKGRYVKNQDSNPGRGMGRYYSEAIDDNGQTIHMRFGVPQFNSLTTFFTGFYNTGAGQLARTGRASSAFFQLGKAAGFVVSIMSWKLLAVHLIGVGLKFLIGKPSSKFYYLKPTMALYWNAVQTMVNQLVVNRGIIPRVGGEDSQRINGGHDNTANIAQLHSLLPDIFTERGGIDVYALSTRGQRLAQKAMKLKERALDTAGNMTNDSLSHRLQQIESQTLSDDSRPSFEGYLQKWFNSANSKPKSPSGDADISNEKDDRTEASNAGFLDFLSAELNDGGAFASFRVTSTGQVSENFSNQTTESELSNKINSMSSQSRSTNFSFGNGNIVGGALGKVVGGVMSAAKDFAAGIGESLEISGLAALGGAAFVDIPKHWQSSQAQLPRSSYTIHLTSPYGNPISQMLNMYIPLCMLLAGALPLSTGKQSYTSPFILELYDQGRCQTRLGMIDSLQVTRGTGNLGFNNEGHAMGIDVTFSVVDLSSIMHMPISEGFDLSAASAGASIGGAIGGAGGAFVGAAGGIPGAAVGAVAGASAGSAAGFAAGGAIDAASSALKAVNGVFDEDTVFSDYMATLAGMSLLDQVYQMRKLKLNVTRQLANWDSFTSPAHMASFAGDSMPGRLVNALFRGTDRS